MAAPVSTKPGWRFGVFEVDARRGELCRSGVPLKLREQSFQILLALLENPGEIVTRDELRHLLWPSDTFVDFDHSLNTAMMKLRAALGDSTDAPIYIETIPKRGYRFVAPVSAIAEVPMRTQADQKVLAQHGNEIVQASNGSAESIPASFQQYRLPTILAVLAIFVVVPGGIFAFLRAHHRAFSPKSDKEATSYRIDSITIARGSFKDPAISPDGRDVAYVWNGGGGDHYDIYVQRIGTLMPHRLTYIKSGFVGFPAWSPDQSEIAFTRCDGVDDGIYTIPAIAGSEKGPERKLTSTGCQYHVPTPVVWLANSRMLLIDRCAGSGLDGLAVFSMETGEKHCIADFGPREWDRRFLYSVSADQKTVAFLPSWENETCEVYTAPISGESPRRIVEDKGRCDDMMWPPGNDIVLFSERTAFPSYWQVPASGGKLRPSIYPAIGSFSKEGRRFVYTERANGEPHTVWRADLASPGGKVLDNIKLIATQFSELDAQPSADGSQLVWAERRALIEEIWRGDSNGQNPYQLTHLNAYSGTPRWSPDGKWIVFDSSTPSGPQIYVIDVEGRNLHAITQGRTMNEVPGWSRDGKSIYYCSVRSGNKEVWKHNLETGNETQVTKHGGFNPFESFDGETVYFSKWDEAGIWSVPSHGGDETPVVAGKPQVMYWGHWALTRPGIYFLDADAEPRARIEFYDFATRRISPVLFLEKNAVWGQPSLSATADGKTIFYSQRDSQSVVKLMEFAE